jgi:hypothetical protein
VNTINLDPPAPEDVLVRLVNNGGADELNVNCKSYRPDHRGAFHVPRRYVTWALKNIAAFVEAPLTRDDALQDVSRAVDAMPECAEKAKLSQAIADLFEDAPAA